MLPPSATLVCHNEEEHKCCSKRDGLCAIITDRCQRLTRQILYLTTAKLAEQRSIPGQNLIAIPADQDRAVTFKVVVTNVSQYLS